MVYHSKPYKKNNIELIVKNRKSIFDNRFIILPHPLINFTIKYPTEKEINSIWIKMKERIKLNKGVKSILYGIPIIYSKELNQFTLCIPSENSNIIYNNTSRLISLN